MNFDNMTEKEAREQILDIVKEYAKKYHGDRPPYKEGDRINYAGRIYGEEEITNLVDSSLEFWLTAGRWTALFEKKLSEYLGVKYLSFANSGSSANLLAFMALTSPLLKERRINKGDEVINVAAGFPTTVAPIIQYGAVPVFIDVTIPEYNADTSVLEEALSDKTKAVFLAHTLGNPFDLLTIRDFCEKHGLWLIEDNCDALGSRYEIDGEKKFTGTVGDIGTSSFFPAHHITTGEGGAVYTDDPLLHKIVRSLRDWGRDCSCPPGADDTCHHRYDGTYSLLPKGYDHKYVYSHFGYNLKSTDMQAAVGCAQIDRLPFFTEKRRENHKKLYEGLSDLKDKLILPEATPGSEPSWFGFLITLNKGISRNSVVRKIEENNVQTRFLFSGNLIKHPCFDDLRDRPGAFRVVGDLTNTDRIMEDSFWVGVYPGMDEDRIDREIRVIRQAVNENS